MRPWKSVDISRLSSFGANYRVAYRVAECFAYCLAEPKSPELLQAGKRANPATTETPKRMYRRQFIASFYRVFFPQFVKTAFTDRRFFLCPRQPPFRGRQARDCGSRRSEYAIPLAGKDTASRFLRRPVRKNAYIAKRRNVL